MAQNLINNESDKKQAVMIATGVIAVAKLISGGIGEKSLDIFLDHCEDLAEEYINRLMKAEKD